VTRPELLRVFVGFLSANLSELHTVEIPLLAQQVEKFLHHFPREAKDELVEPVLRLREDLTAKTAALYRAHSDYTEGKADAFDQVVDCLDAILTEAGQALPKS